VQDRPERRVGKHHQGYHQRVTPRMTNISRSQVENLPVTVMPIRKMAPMGTAMYGLTPK